MEFEILDYYVAKRLDDLETSGAFSDLTDVWRDLPPYFGLKSIDRGRYWFKEHEKESLLVIVDKKQWMLARIKYGI